MKNLLLAFALILFTPFAFAQLGGAGGDFATITDLIDPSAANTDLLYGKKSNVVGSPFWGDEWQKGYVKLKSGQQVEEMEMKYDLYNDVLIVKLDEKSGSMGLLPLSEFTLGDLIFKPYILGSLPKERFAQVLFEDDKATFVKQGKVTLVKGDAHAQQGGYGESKAMKDQLKRANIYWVMVDGAKFRQVKLGKSFIKDVLPDQQSKLLAYAKKEKLKLKDEIDIVRLLQYYSSL